MRRTILSTLLLASMTVSLAAGLRPPTAPSPRPSPYCFNSAVSVCPPSPIRFT